MVKKKSKDNEWKKFKEIYDTFPKYLQSSIQMIIITISQASGKYDLSKSDIIGKSLIYLKKKSGKSYAEIADEMNKIDRRAMLDANNIKSNIKHGVLLKERIENFAQIFAVSSEEIKRGYQVQQVGTEKLPKNMRLYFDSDIIKIPVLKEAFMSLNNSIQIQINLLMYSIDAWASGYEGDEERDM